MRIGLDLDDTIFNTKEQYKKYQQIYLEKNKITEEQLWKERKHRVDYISNNLSLIFSDIKIKKDAIKVIKKLKENGHKIYIITARSKEYRESIYNFTKKSLDDNKIPYDELLLTEKYKLKSCQKNNIDLMIDNSIDIYNELNGKIDILLFDEHNKYPNIKNRVNNWQDIYNLLIRRSK